MLMVIILHTAAPLLYRFNGNSDINWITGNIYDSLVRACVPLFFMISGFLLLEKSESTSSFFRKRLNKILIPMIFWSVVFIVWRIYYENQNIDFFDTLLKTILAPSYYHLWFVYTLAGTYLAIPILRAFVSKASNINLLYLVAIWFFCVGILPLIEKLLATRSKYDIGMFTGYAGYLVLGSLLGRFIYSRKHAALAIASITCGVIITAYGTYSLTASKGAFVGTYYDYLFPSIITTSAGWFVLFKYLLEDRKKPITETAFDKIIISFSSLSFGIYFVHAMYITLLKFGTLGIKSSALYGNPLLSIPITVILTLVLSYSTIWLFSKTPLLKKVI